eukprot:PRCOL_00005371-RA
MPRWTFTDDASGREYWVAATRRRGIHYNVLVDLTVKLLPEEREATWRSVIELPEGTPDETGIDLTAREGLKVGDHVRITEFSNTSFMWERMSNYDVRELRRECAGPAGAAAKAKARALPLLGARTRGQCECDALRERGNAALKRGDSASAVKLYTMAISHNRADARAYGNRALAHLRLKRWREAVSDCEMVLTFDSTNVKALMRRASAREALKDFDWAEQDLGAALVLEPSNADAKIALARVKALNVVPLPAAPAAISSTALARGTASCQP